MRKMRLLTTVIFAAMLTTTCLANNNWAWGPDEVSAKGNWMKMDGLIKQNKYKEATGSVVWLLENTPKLNVALYINAIKVYEKKVKLEKDATKKRILQDSTLALYDQRIVHFGNENKVLNRKGRVAWKYLSKRENTNEELYGLYSKIYSLNSNGTKAINLYNLMQSASVQFVNEKLTKDELFGVFEKCNQTFDHQISTKKKVTRIEKYKALSIMSFAKHAKLDCNLIGAKFGKEFAKEKTISKANMIISLCVAQKCFSDSSFVEASQFLSDNGKANYSLEVTLAKAYAKRGSDDEAILSFDKALVLTEDSLKKAELCLEKAKIEGKRNHFPLSRQLAREALQYNKDLKSAHAHIGDLYIQGADLCSSGNKVENRSVYIAAASQYKKAGMLKKAADMKLQFPSVEELFLYNLKEGDTFQTKCWIGEKVILQVR